MQIPYETDTGRTDDGLPSSFEGSSVPGASTFNHPDQVISAVDLTKSQKRMLLASWASDRRAVENAPSRRLLDSGAVVSIDDILQAMTALDSLNEPMMSRASGWFVPRRTTRPAANLLRRTKVRSVDRDDDPSPPAATAARPFSPIFTKVLARAA